MSSCCDNCKQPRKRQETGGIKMNARTKKMIDNKIWAYLEEQEPYWLKAIISTAKEILEEKEE
tara:strand:- start:270 stop:458 length:189 start_codon:yes stop_codon:yes gene_type:complete